MGDGVKFLLGTLSISVVLLMVAVSWTNPHPELLAVHGGTEPQLADLVDSPLMYAKVSCLCEHHTFNVLKETSRFKGKNR
jgi:hypothetical protein